MGCLFLDFLSIELSSTQGRMVHNPFFFGVVGVRLYVEHRKKGKQKEKFPRWEFLLG